MAEYNLSDDRKMKAAKVWKQVTLTDVCTEEFEKSSDNKYCVEVCYTSYSKMSVEVC
jgi:hypothetical protein